MLRLPVEVVPGATARLFSPEARAAASVSRMKRAALKAMIKDGLEVFITKGACGTTEFTWEIRRFGGLTMEHTPVCYPTRDLARAAGDAALRLRNGSEVGETGAAASVLPSGRNPGL